jgi:hypothetical protein
MWRHRWPLTPVLLAGVTVAGAQTAPARTGLVLAGAAGLLEVAARWPRVRTIGGRAWLSQRERRTAALGLAAAAGWVTLADAVPGLSWRVQAVLLAAVLGAPAATWWGARRTQPGKLSPLAARLVADWATKVAAEIGPKPLRDSTVITASVAEPVEGTVTMTVRLAGVHASNATSTQLRRAVEVALGLPMDTVRLDAVRDDAAADRIAVTMGATRHLEKAPTEWPGPILNDDGSIPTALDAGGATVSIHLFNKDGVEHGVISGSSGTGKGGSSVVVSLPGVLAKRQIVFYADGKHGMSAPEIHPLATRLALDAKTWAVAIDIVHAIMEAREKRYGKAGTKRFEAGKTSDPIITLLLDEASTLARVLSPKRISKVEQIAERGRSTGVQLIQVSQSVRSDKIIGGVPVRDLLTGAGFSISHKPGGGSAARLATDGIQVAGLAEALQALPAEPGMAVITRRGNVLSTQARVFDAEKGAIAEIEAWLQAGNRPLELTGPDLAAAGAAYTDWPVDEDAAGDTDSQTAADGGEDGEDQDDDEPGGTSTPAKPATKTELHRAWILDALDAAGLDGATADDLANRDGAPSRSTIFRHLPRLMGAGEVTNTDGIWRIAGLPLDQDDDLDDDLDDELDDEECDDEADEVIDLDDELDHDAVVLAFR